LKPFLKRATTPGGKVRWGVPKIRKNDASRSFRNRRYLRGWGPSRVVWEADFEEYCLVKMKRKDRKVKKSVSKKNHQRNVLIRSGNENRPKKILGVRQGSFYLGQRPSIYRTGRGGAED